MSHRAGEGYLTGGGIVEIEHGPRGGTGDVFGCIEKIGVVGHDPHHLAHLILGEGEAAFRGIGPRGPGGAVG